MKTELMLVTPKMAREWLNKNTSNRPLRTGVVNGFKNAYDRGEWKITHQGIAFGISGKLLDGQHRLTFIGSLPEKSAVPVNVTTDQDDDTFDAIDQGFKRTISDIHAVSSDLVAVGRFFARIMDVGGYKNALTPQYVKPFIDWVQPEYEALLSFSPKYTRMWATAPVRSAAIYNLKTGIDRNFVRLAYDSLVHLNVGAMPPAVRLLAHQHMSGKIASSRSFDLFCRAQKAFDPANASLSKIVIKDTAGQISDVRTLVLAQMKKRPDEAGQVGVKPSAYSTVRRVA